MIKLQHSVMQRLTCLHAMGALRRHPPQQCQSRQDGHGVVEALAKGEGVWATRMGILLKHLHILNNINWFDVDGNGGACAWLHTK